MPRRNRFTSERSAPVRLLRRWVGKLGAIGAVLGLSGLLALGWYWQATLQCGEVEVQGAVHADAGEVREMARIDSGTVLYDIDTDVVRDRVTDHAWVESAAVTRIPTGTLLIQVTERKPAVLVVDERDRPAYYLDAAGYQMPYKQQYLHDVPLVRSVGMEYEPREPVEASSLRAFLEALEKVNEVEPLISEIQMNDGMSVTLQTVPGPAGQSLPVRLGRGNFTDKLRRLRAFWHQVVEQEQKRFNRVDLRFDDQVVVRTAD